MGDESRILHAAVAVAIVGVAGCGPSVGDAGGTTDGMDTSGAATGSAETLGGGGPDEATLGGSGAVDGSDAGGSSAGTAASTDTDSAGVDACLEACVVREVVEQGWCALTWQRRVVGGCEAFCEQVGPGLGDDEFADARWCIENDPLCFSSMEQCMCGQATGELCCWDGSPGPC